MQRFLIPVFMAAVFFCAGCAGREAGSPTHVAAEPTFGLPAGNEPDSDTTVAMRVAVILGQEKGSIASKERLIIPNDHHACAVRTQLQQRGIQVTVATGQIAEQESDATWTVAFRNEVVVDQAGYVVAEFSKGGGSAGWRHKLRFRDGKWEVVDISKLWVACG